MWNREGWKKRDRKYRMFKKTLVDKVQGQGNKLVKLGFKCDILIGS